MHGLLPFCAILWLSCLIQLINGAAESNVFAHAYERIWLYEMYDLFCDIDGTYGPDHDTKWQVGLPRQEKLFGCWKSQWQKGPANVGSGPNGRLDFAEFLHRLEGKAVPSQGIPEGLPRDDSWKTMDRKLLADKMISSSRAGTIEMVKSKICETFYDKYKAPTDDPLKSNFVHLFERIEAEYTKMRLDPTKNSKITDDRKARLTVLGERIVTMREEDIQRYLARTLRDGALPKVIVVPTDSLLPNHPRYDRIDLQRTWRDVYKTSKTADPEVLKWSGRTKASGAKRYLFSYVNDNGKDTVGIDFPQQARQHRRVITTWEKFLEYHKKPDAELASCRS